ncbi:MAG TPA: pantoate--beta-alanine ligase [Actinomycetota bacterium]|nr:pantoate--beta-alanine ligase [Actinomycetota bacterium]
MTVRTIPRMRTVLWEARGRGDTVGFIPTMGALHEGHLSLVRRGRNECGFVVVSIFVNPTQFDVEADFQAYPRNLEDDAALCQEAGVDAVFSPGAGEMYPEPPLTRISMPALTQTMEGAVRPGHFEGVALIVSKLFSIMGTCRAYFGEKDAQQLCVVSRLASDLDMPVEVVGCPTTRESDGLAMSSRNIRIPESDRPRALCLSQALFSIRDAIQAGQRDVEFLISLGMTELTAARPDAVDYLEIVDPATLRPATRVESDVLVCGAIRVAGTRLIDNVRVHVAGPSGDPLGGSSAGEGPADRRDTR